MAKRTRMLPARKPRNSRDDESLLMRSAESLGRMIGTLQRQLDGATRRLAVTADEDSRTGGGARKRASKRASNSSGATRRKPAASRRAVAKPGAKKNTRTAAAKSAKKR
jgi:hypothetical protein